MSIARLGRSAALALLALVALPAIALADDPAPQEKNNAAALIACMTVVPLALVPLGLAFHLLLRAVFPRRIRQIVHATETLRVACAVAGFVNAIVFFLVIVGAQHAAPPLAFAATILFGALAFSGLHGVARALGARALGGLEAEPLAAARSEVRELAVGWFVLAYVACFPFVGWTIGAWWIVRALGAVVVSFASRDES